MSQYQASAHHERLANALMAVERGETRRLMVTMPPRHGKSELVSVRFPAWYIGRNPDKRVVIASYASDLAQRFSRQVRSVVTSEKFGRMFPGVALNQMSRAVDAWDIANKRGGLKAVGVGGPLTGHGGHLIIVDDPVKNREEANSEVVRQSIFDWYTSTLYTRQEENAAICVVMTRWHEDDLAGRLITAMNDDPKADQWEIIHLPAIDDDGNALWPEKYDLQELERIRTNVGDYDWQALYQGSPSAKGGLFFKVGMIEVVDAAPAVMRTCRAWDLGATGGAGDPTAGVKIGVSSDNIWYILDIVHGQWESDIVRKTIMQTAQMDGIECQVRLPQDPGQAGKAQANDLTRMLAGFNVRAEAISGDKAVRAFPLAAQINAGNIKMVKGIWNRDFIEELRTFPMGVHDDRVDATSDGFNTLAACPTWSFY